MNYKIIGSVEVTKSGRKRTLIKWVLYAAILVFSYSLMRSGVFRGWQPVFVITAFEGQGEELVQP